MAFTVRLDEAHRRSLHRTGDTDLVAAHGQDGIIEARAGQQCACRRHPEAHGDRHPLLRLVVFVHDLPHVGAGRDLKGAHIAPTEIHAVVAEIGPAIEFGSGDAAYARSYCELRLVRGVPDRHQVLVHVLWRLDHVLLAGSLVLGDLNRLERMAERIGELLDPLGIILPAEHLVDHLHVAEQVGQDTVMRFAFDIAEQNRTAAIHVLLQTGDFEVRIDGLVSLDQIALLAQPIERAAQIGGMLLPGWAQLFLAHGFLHSWSSHY
jgi:hypothetical protein